MRFCTALLFLLICDIMPAESRAWAEVLHFQNGDRVTGKIISQTEETITMQTRSMGTVIINKEQIKPEKGPPSKNAAVPETAVWKRKIALGYSQTGGNTERSHGAVSFKADRKTEINELTFQGDSYYGSSDGRMDARKFYGLTRYARSFGSRLAWYDFYKFESDQDRFANIDYRLIPSFGVGYWFWDNDAAKAMAEMAIGYEYTNYHDGTPSGSEPIIIPRGYVERKLTKTLKVSEDLTFYPHVEEWGTYRVRSKSSLTNALTNRLSLSLRFINEYDSRPTGLAKKNDYRLISSVDYMF